MGLFKHLSGAASEAIEQLDAKILIALFLTALTAVFFLLFSQGNALAAARDSGDSLIASEEGIALSKWINAKATLLRLDGKALSLEGIVPIGEGAGDAGDYNRRKIIVDAVIEIEGFKEKIRSIIFMELYLDGVGENEGSGMADENTIAFIAGKGVDKALLQGISSEKAQRIIFLSKYLEFAGKSQDVLLNALESSDAEASKRIIDSVANLYDVDLKEYFSGKRTNREILFGKDIDGKIREIDALT